MSRSRKLHFVFSDKHKQYIRDCLHSTCCVAEGAVRAGKTIDNVFAFCTDLETTEDKIHLATGSTIAAAKLNIGDCNGFGIEYQYRGRSRWGKYKGNEALYVKTKTGQKVIIFAGGAKADSFKKIRGNSYGMWIATEINLHHDNTIKEAFNRQLAAKNRRIFWDLNPSAPQHQIYTEYIDRFPEQFGDKYNYQHFTIHDNATISEERRKEIEQQYDPASVWYRRDILGERCAAEGLVYEMFDNSVHTYKTAPWEQLSEKEKKKEHPLYYVSIDYGTMNPTSMGLWRIYNGVAYRTKEYYYDGRKERHQKTDNEYYDDLERFVGDLSIQSIVVDPSAASFITLMRRRGKFSIRKAVNDVLPGIRTTAAYLNAGKILIHESCESLISEVGLYSWDEKAKGDAVIKEHDNACDDMLYFVMTIMRRQLKGKI